MDGQICGSRLSGLNTIAHPLIPHRVVISLSFFNKLFTLFLYVAFLAESLAMNASFTFFPPMEVLRKIRKENYIMSKKKRVKIICCDLIRI
jgi:hypothetical protein